MVKIQLLVLFFGFSFGAFCQYPFEQFDANSASFDSSRHSEYYLLTSKVKPLGEIEWRSQAGTRDFDYLIELLLNPIYELKPRHKNLLRAYMKNEGHDELITYLDSSISENSKGTKAKYFVIHDTSFPNYLLDSIPGNINDSSWKYNDLDRWFGMNGNRKAVAHSFISRDGKILFQKDYAEAWRATKIELQKIDASISKGLFLHTELVQPRQSDSSKWSGNDILAPSSGFSPEQYQKLALMYIFASVRKGEWLMPAFHAVLDAGIKDAHDDPQNFRLRKFYRSIQFLMQRMDRDLDRVQYFAWDEPNDSALSAPVDLWATWYYVPVVESVDDGIPLLNENMEETGFALDSCAWCDAVIQGTVMFKTDSGDVLLNYADRSENLQYDCRKCEVLANYKGYERSGQVLFKESYGYGEGVDGHDLVPFRSIATDPNFIPHGSVVYIPEAVGAVVYVRGTKFTHDGYFYAADTGSAIKENHIDVFIGTATMSPFDFVKSQKNGTFKAYIISDENTEKYLRIMHDV